jgi:hypothetical protein
MKDLKVSEKNWEKIMNLKIAKKCKSVDAVIDELLREVERDGQ